MTAYCCYFSAEVIDNILYYFNKMISDETFKQLNMFELIIIVNLKISPMFCKTLKTFVNW